MIVQAISLLDDLDKELNNYVMRAREWYGWHFPELGKIVTDNLAFAKTIKMMGKRSHVVNCCQTKQCKTCTASHGHAHCCSGSRTTNFAAVSRMIVYFVTYMVDVTWFNEPEKSSLARTSSPLSYVLRETMSCEYVLKMITWFIGVRTNAMDMDFSAVLPEEVASELKTAAEISMGTEVSDEDINNIKYLCDQVIIWSRFPQVSCTNLSLQCCSRWC